MVLLGMLFAFIAIVFTLQGEWLGIVFFGVIALFLALGMSEIKKDWKAHDNRRDYWLNGGPDRSRKK